MKIDLHLHSTASDGSLSPSALVWAARSGGLDVIALTDHDTCTGIDEALGSLPDNLHLIPGIELSTTLDGAELHILGYFIDHNHPRLVEHARTAAERRSARVRNMLGLLADRGINLSYDDVLAAAGTSTGVLGRPHVARALQRAGHVQTIGEAFDRLIGDSGPCFLPTELLDPRSAIELIIEAGGISAWAHPRYDQFERLLPQLMEWGIQGVECIRPRSLPSEIQFYEGTTKEKNLLVTGGSDWHGSWHGRLGDWSVTHDEVEDLLAAGGM